jgi:hypothetical protein
MLASKRSFVNMIRLLEFLWGKGTLLVCDNRYGCEIPQKMDTESGIHSIVVLRFFSPQEVW